MNDYFNKIKKAFDEADVDYKEAIDMLHREANSGYVQRDYKGNEISMIGEHVARLSSKLRRDARQELAKKLKEITVKIEEL